MAKYPIEKGVPEQVSVEEPVIREIHEKLSGKQALPGSPAGREAHPSPKIVGTPPGIGR